jgi:hypothetical protein
VIALLRLLGAIFFAVAGYSYHHGDLLLTVLALCASGLMFYTSVRPGGEVL